MELKTYQARALESVDSFFAEYRERRDPAAAFRAAPGRANVPYFPAPGLAEVPYFCIRIPTGGGKTLIAAHAIGRINAGLLQQERSLVLWLAPTDQIVSDTLRSLQSPDHPYRQALQASVGGGQVEIIDLAQAINLQRSTLEDSTVVIVSTMASLRVSDTTGRRVYASNGQLLPHFAGLPPGTVEALRAPAEAGGQPGPVEYSLANVLRLRRPVVIVDEAHNANTSLSFETLARFSPSCLMELTATPNTVATARQSASNVLYSVSASQLKAEAMIKMPVKLETHPNWQTIVTRALEWRDRLELDAQGEQQQTGEQIRPIILYQAQPNSQTQDNVTAQRLRQELVEIRGIPEEQVKVATGENNELRGINLNDPASPVRHVITVQALREGWDCPQAYVLCAVASLRSQTAIEQIVGRVLRMPLARRKRTDTLNHAYVFAVSENLGHTLRKLGDGLTSSGFSSFEARYLIEAQPLPGMEASLAPAVAVPDTVTLEQPIDVSQLSPALQAKLSYEADTGTLRVTSGAVFDDQEADQVLGQLPSLPDQIRVERLINDRQASPAERGLPFRVPLLAVREADGTASLFDQSVLIEPGWNLDQSTPMLSAEEYEGAGRPVQRGLIDVNRQGQVVQTADPLGPAQAMLVNAADPTITTPADVARWIDRAFRHEDVSSQESLRFIMRAVRYLLDERRIPLQDLVYDRYRLRDAVQRKILALKEGSRRRAFAQALPGLIIAPDEFFEYPADYPAAAIYDGPHRFQRHYYRRPGDLNAVGEEFDVAVALDSLPGVRYWVRNLSRRPRHSFWFQTASDKAYPDFVALLDDGRVVAIEYKGAHLLDTADTREKADLGALWTRASEGRALYILLTRTDVPRLAELMGL